MDNANISLFNSDLQSVALPSVTEGNTDLYSNDISEIILAPKVETLIVPKDSQINSKNFIFDFSEISSISVIQKEVLKSLVDENGEVELYMYKKNGLKSFGLGEKYHLERIIPLVKKFIFGDEIKIYKDYQIGGTLYEVTGRDFTNLRLSI